MTTLIPKSIWQKGVVVNKILRIISFFCCVIIFSSSANSEQLSYQNHIECPPSLDVFNSIVKDRHGLVIQKYRNEKANHITYVTLDGYGFLNGNPLPLSGWIHFKPPLSAQEIAEKLQKAASLKGPKSLLSRGVMSCSYDYESNDEKEENVFSVTIDSKKAGILYQCPLPEEISIQEKRETQLVKMKTLPYKTQQALKASHNVSQIVYVDRDRAFAANGVDGYYNVEGPLGTLIIDTTSKEGKPLLYEKVVRNGDDRVFTYKFGGYFGPVALASYSVDKHVEKAGLTNIDNPQMARYINRGAGEDNQHRAVDSQGNIIVPPCKATQVIKTDSDLRVRCIYGSTNDPDKTIILESVQDLDQEINYKKCTVWGGRYKGETLYDLLNNKNGTATLWSIKNNGTHIAPVTIFCTR